MLEILRPLCFLMILPAFILGWKIAEFIDERFFK